MKWQRTAPDPHRDHAVQFYRDDEALLTTLSRFVRDGLSVAQPVVIIASASHRASLLGRLVRDGVPRDQFDNGLLWMLDARETLATFMEGRTPDAARFRAAIGDVIAAARLPGGGTVRAYGEMVDLLWKEGNPEAALRLEELWNALAAAEHFTLLCGYSMGNFHKLTPGFDIGDVCHVHARVLPA